MKYRNCSSCKSWSGKHCKKGKDAPPHHANINSCIEWQQRKPILCKVGLHNLDDTPLMTWGDGHTYYRCKRCLEEIKVK